MNSQSVRHGLVFKASSNPFTRHRMFLEKAVVSNRPFRLLTRSWQASGRTFKACEAFISLELPDLRSEFAHVEDLG